MLVVVFFGTWFLLSWFDYVKHFKIAEVTAGNERKLGNLVLEAVKNGHEELESDSLSAFVDGLKTHLCRANGVQDSSIDIHIIVVHDVNAFAVPGRHLVIYTGLITYCNSPDELAGVVAHEISHMERGHVMRKLMKEAGLSMLLTIAGGDAGRGIVQQLVKMLSSTAFDREQEAEADRSAVQMLMKADIDPEPFANFLFRLSQEKANIPKQFEWISTHPNSQDRASEILKLRKQEVIHPRPIADSVFWANMKKLVSSKDK